MDVRPPTALKPLLDKASGRVDLRSQGAGWGGAPGLHPVVKDEDVEGVSGVVPQVVQDLQHGLPGLTDLLTAHGPADVDDEEDVLGQRCQAWRSEEVGEVVILHDDAAPIRVTVDTVDDGELTMDASLGIKVALHFHCGSEHQLPCPQVGCHVRLNRMQMSVVNRMKCHRKQNANVSGEQNANVSGEQNANVSG